MQAVEARQHFKRAAAATEAVVSMQERDLCSLLRQTAAPPQMHGISDDWMFGITPDRGSAFQLPATTHSSETDPRSTHLLQATTSEAEHGQSGAQPNAQADLASPNSATAVASGNTAGGQNPCLAPSSAAVFNSPQPVEALPASVKEAVDRFESWTITQSTAALPSVHTQPPMQQTQQKGTPLQQGQTQQRLVLSLQQHSLHMHRSGDADLLQQQAVPLQHGASSQRTDLLSGVPTSRSTGASVPAYLPTHSTHHAQHSQAPLDIPPMPHQQASSAGIVAAVIPSVPTVTHQSQSSASAFIEATLASINSDQSKATELPKGPMAYTDRLPLVGPNSPAGSAPQATSGPPQVVRQAASAPTGVAQRPLLTPVAGGMQRPPLPPAVVGGMPRPPLPSKHAGQVFLTRPRFSDAFANPSLYQQPWLQSPASSGDTGSAPRAHAADMSQARWGGESSGPFDTNYPATAQGEERSSGRSSRAGTTAVADDAKDSLRTGVGPQHQADSDMATSDQAHASLILNPHSSARCSQKLGSGTTAGTNAGRVATGAVQSQQEDKRSSPGGAEEVGWKGGSRWSAVNAYRQAREAAARAAGTHFCPALLSLPCPCYNYTQLQIACSGQG